MPGFSAGKSEPEHFIEFAERIPGWCVVIGLIEGGQEIHVGEEAGLVQWRDAVEGSGDPSAWKFHGPPGVRRVFEGSTVPQALTDGLNLDTEIRFHLATDLHRYVSELLDAAPADENAKLARRLEAQGYHLRISRDLKVAKQYLRDRYQDHREARYGLVASSKDRDLQALGVPNDFQSTKRVQYGPWYGDDESAAGGRSCRLLREAVTEFGAQGLELDAVLLAWGTALMMASGRWSNARARGYLRRAHVINPYQLRINAYRVLLTRGRDATVVFVPSLPELDQTWGYLVSSGFAVLD
jgi:hypothetical protein